MLYKMQKIISKSSLFAKDAFSSQIYALILHHIILLRDILHMEFQACRQFRTDLKFGLHECQKYQGKALCSFAVCSQTF